MIKTILIIGFVTGWQVSAKEKKARKVASHPVHHEFVAIKAQKNKTFPRQNICIIKSEKTGILKFKAQSYEKAFSLGIESCFQKQTGFFIKTKKQYPGQDKQIEFAKTCLDNIRCL